MKDRRSHRERPQAPSRPWAIVGDNAEQLRVRIAAARHELEAAYRLVYSCYLDRGYIPALPRGIFYRLSYGVPTSRTVVADTPAGLLTGTLTVVGDSRLGLPMEGVFHREVDRLRREPRRLAEVSGLCVEPARRSASLATFFALTRFLIQYACWQRMDDLLISIHPSHLPFYERQFHFTSFGPCRRYEALRGQPAIACRLDLRRLRETTDPAVYSAYLDQPIDPQAFRIPPISPADHAYLCRLAGWLPDEDGERGRRAAAA